MDYEEDLAVWALNGERWDGMSIHVVSYDCSNSLEGRIHEARAAYFVLLVNSNVVGHIECNAC